MKTFAIILLALVSLEAFSQPSQNLLSEAEALRFCRETWFPKLRLGIAPSSEALGMALESLMPLYTEDVELVDPNNLDLFGIPILKGKSLVRKYYEVVLKSYPLWTFDILAIYPTPSGFIVRYQGKDAFPVKSFEGVDIVELRKEGAAWKISKLIEYYDRKPFAVSR